MVREFWIVPAIEKKYKNDDVTFLNAMVKSLDAKQALGTYHLLVDKRHFRFEMSISRFIECLTASWPRTSKSDEILDDFFNENRVEYIIIDDKGVYLSFDDFMKDVLRQANYIIYDGRYHP